MDTPGCVKGSAIMEAATKEAAEGVDLVA